MPHGFLFPSLEVMNLTFIRALEFLNIFFLNGWDAAGNTRGTAWLGWEEWGARLQQGKCLSACVCTRYLSWLRLDIATSLTPFCGQHLDGTAERERDRDVMRCGGYYHYRPDKDNGTFTSCCCLLPLFLPFVIVVFALVSNVCSSVEHAG